MSKTLRLAVLMLMVSTMLSGCIVVPLWGDDGYYHHHDHGWYGRR